MNHLTPEQLSAHLDGATGAEERAAAERHLAGCESCREALAELAALDASLGGVLEHDPGEAYFASFADRVEQRLRAEGMHGAQARGGDSHERPWLDWLRSPRRLAWLAATVAVIGGAAVVFMTSHEDRLTALDESRVARESRVGEPAPERPLAQVPAPGGGGLDATAPRAEEPATPRGTTREPMAAKDETAGGAAATGTSERERGADRAAPSPAPASEHMPVAAKAEAPTASAPAESRTMAAAPQRLTEVRRDASGNVVPVTPEPAMARFAPPPAPAPEVKEGEPVRVRKQNVATPLGTQSAAPPAAKGAASSELAKADEVAPGESALCGVVADASQRPLSGATVTLVGLGRVTFSGPDGRFCLNAPAGDHELLVSAVGFGERRVQVHVAGERADVQVALDAVSVLGSGKLAGGARPGGISEGFAARPGGALTIETHAADPFASLPDSVRMEARDAQRLSAAAATQRTAAAHELAAGRWEHVLMSVPPAGAAANTARYRVAEARYGAWRATPTTARATTATRALDAFLAAAPAGAQRDLALSWRAALPH